VSRYFHLPPQKASKRWCF